MKSKPFGALFGLLALVTILGVTPAFGQTTNEIHIAKDVGTGGDAACITANNCFTPSTITVTPGTTVTWVNTGSVPHAVLSGKPTDNDAGSLFHTSDTSPLKLGETFQFTFDKEGKYDYFDPINPWMVGQVIVSVAASTTPGNATVPEFGPVASIVLAIAVLSIVVFAAKTRVIPRL